MSSSSSSSTRGWKPDVFLNFYGDDTRNGFTSHLYAAFTEKGINAFMDDEKLERGKLIAPELCKAIEESKYAVVVLSRNYALSRWCLFELATIVECKKKKMLTILPIFYHVEPSHLRHQTGSFAEAFVRYEQNPNLKREDLQTWKAALREVGNTAGWPLGRNRSESAIIKEILATIQGSSKLSSGVCKDQVGLIDKEFRGENFSKLKDIDQSDHDVLGIICDGRSQEVVLKLDIHDDKAKRTAIKTVSTLAGIESIRMDMKVKKLTVIGTMDPIELVSKLSKYCFADIISIGRPKQEVEKKGEPRSWKEEPKKEEKKGQQVEKEEIKKKEEEEEKISELVKAYNAYNPYRTSHNYYVQSMEEKPKEKEAKKKENIEWGDHFEEIANNYRAYYNPNVTQYYHAQTAEESNPNSCVIC